MGKDIIARTMARKARSLAVSGVGLYEVVAATHAGYPDKGHSHTNGASKVSTRVSHIVATDIDEVAFTIGTSGTSINGYTAKGIVYDNKGARFPITVNGNENIRVEPLSIVKTDFLKKKFIKDETFWTVWCIVPDVAGSIPAYMWLESNFGEGVGKNQDWTITGVLPSYSPTPSDTNNTNGYGFAPIAIHGKTARQNVVSLALIGDSILDGVGENQPPVFNDLKKWAVNGYIERGLKNRFGFSNWGVSNEFLSQATATLTPAWTYKRRLMDHIPFNAAIIEYPINDIKGGGTLTQIRNNMSDLIKFIKSKGVKVIYLCTVTPVTTSTDTWATTTNQTVTATESVRTAHNDDVRNGYYDVSGFFEVADAVETARNSGIWKAGYTGDGIHPVSIAVNEMAKAVLPDTIKQSLIMIN